MIGRRITPTLPAMRSPPRFASRAVRGHLRELEQAETYAAWRAIALELDRLDGADTWALDETSDDYDFELIRQRLLRMRALRLRADVRQLAFELYEGLHGNLGNIANPALYSVARGGTKRLIAEYVHEVARCLDFICAGDFAEFDLEAKIQFFKRTATSFGRSALMLSGGGALGMFHLGVIKALHAEKLLPRVLSGASAGAIIACGIAVRSDAELDAMFAAGGLNLDAFQALGWREILRGGSIMDSAQLERCIAENIGDLTFVEAFERTHRIVGITVSPAEAHQQGRLLNYLTAPHVLMRRAVLASCAVPGVFAPVQLEARDYLNQVVPYLPNDRWLDGTLSSDLPMLRLARLHNVNHYIVSQTNPHVVPMLAAAERERRGFAPLARELMKQGSSGALRIARKHLDPYGGGMLLGKIDNIVHQRYSGDINIFPVPSPRRMLGIFANPSADDIQIFIREGERATWPKIERIRLQTHISRTFEDCISILKAREHERVRAGDPRSYRPQRGSR